MKAGCKIDFAATGFLYCAKIGKVGRKRELVSGFPRRILSKAMSKIAKGKSNRADMHAEIAEPLLSSAKILR
jgi:hypothetical protein